MRISQSKVKTWRRCRQQYHFKYVEKLRSRRKRRPLMFGSIVHDMIQAHLNGDDPFEVLARYNVDNEKLFSAEKEMYGEIIEDIRLIMTDYFEHWPDRNLQAIRINRASAEHEFELDLGDDLVFTGKIDEIADAPTKLRWLVEHKTFARRPSDDDRWRSLQSAVYIRAIELLGWSKKAIAGVCWDYVWSKAPTIPNMLKNGNLSTAKIDTLPTVVLEEIKRLKLSKRENLATINMAKERRSSYFFRIFTPAKKSVIDLLFAGFVDTAREIVEHHGKKQDKNIDRHCDWCDYEPICRAQLLNHDEAFIREREYYADQEEGEDSAGADAA